MRRADGPRPPARGRDDSAGAHAADRPRSDAIDWAALSHALAPTALRCRAIEVTVETDRDRYDPGEPVGITVGFRNRFPVPIRLRTDSPTRWTWAVDGEQNASQVPRAVPDRPAAFDFARRERKRFTRRWPQRLRVADDRWEPVGPGTYSITAGIDRADAADRGLVDRTEIRIGD